MRRGFLWALLATVAFGVTTPVIALIGSGAGAWSTAGWLYLGAAAFALIAQREPRQLARGLRTQWRMLAAVAVVGGMVAPAAYIVGLRSAGALTASLALNMEAPFSALIAALVFKEHVGRRAWIAMLAIVVGACALGVRGGPDGAQHAGALGLLLVVAATALWAVDNVLSARLSELDPRVTIFWKSTLGGSLALLAGRVMGETIGAVATIFALLAVGAIGYGASLLCYLIAQRQFGVARTASVFAAAPLIGAAGAFVMGDHPLGIVAIAAFGAMFVGVWLHATEQHHHEHRHPAAAHDHAHRHDDLHHVHPHDVEPVGEHRHPHTHAPISHAHDHAPDIEHAHPH